MKKAIELFINYPILVKLALGVLLIFGLISFNRLRTNNFPDQKVKHIFIDLGWPGASPYEIEEGVVTKIEEQLKGVTGIDEVTSVSREGFGKIDIELLSKVNPDLVLKEIENAIDNINSFPPDFETPIIYKDETFYTAISFALHGDLTLAALKEFADKVELDLLAKEGISKIEIHGLPNEEIEVALDEYSLQKFNISIEQIATAIRQANIETTAGTIETATEDILVRAKTKAYFAKDLMRIPILGGKDGKILYLHDVADVKDQFADEPNKRFLDGEPAVVFRIRTGRGQDIIKITDTIKNYIDGFNTSNQIVRASVVEDISVGLNERMRVLAENGILGAIFIVFLLAFFLNWRIAFWVGLGIPVAFFGTFIFASLFDVTINQLTLFGAIIVLGILVDDGVVIGENIFQRFEKGMTPVQSAVNGTIEVFPSVLIALMTTALAFGLFFFVDGTLGEFFSAMSFVVIAALTISIIEVTLFLPSHLVHSNSFSNNSSSGVSTWGRKLMSWLRARYVPVLDFFTEYKPIAIALPIALLIMALGLVNNGFVGTAFFPNIEENSVSVSIELQEGTNEAVTRQYLSKIEKSTWLVSEDLAGMSRESGTIVKNIEAIIGPSSNSGSLNITIVDAERRRIRASEIAELIREKTGPMPAAKNLTFGTVSPFGEALSISLYSTNNDLQELVQARNVFRSELSKVKELKDISDNYKEGMAEVNVKLKEKAYSLNVTIADVIKSVRDGYYGIEVQRLQRGANEVKVWVRYSTSDKSDINGLQNIHLPLAGDSKILLSEVAIIEIENGISEINHRDGLKEIVFAAEIADLSASVPGILAGIERDIMPNVQNMYPNIEYTFGGQNRATEKTAASVQKAGPIILVLMISLIVIAFKSFSQTLAVLFLIPFSITGVIVGHMIHGLPISVFSILGFIALIGIVVNNAVVLVNTFNKELGGGGHDVIAALKESAISRFRPIILTTITTTAGLAPLIAGRSLGAQFLKPVAVSIAYGLMYSTVLTLILLPACLVFQHELKETIQHIFKLGKINDPRQVVQKI